MRTGRPTLLAEILALLVRGYGLADVHDALTRVGKEGNTRPPAERRRTAEIAARALAIVPPDELARARARRARKE